MSGFRGYGSLGDAARAGQVHNAHFRKIPSQASTAGHWVDLTMAAGNPQPNYYASTPLAAALLDPFRGLWAGDSVSPASKHVMELALCSPTAALVGTYRLLDYLVYYPFIDMDDPSTQSMDNSVTLTRYSTGENVRAMMVCVAPTVGGGSFTYDYINQDGIARSSPVNSCNTTAASIATIATSQQAVAAGGGLFLSLADGDTGIRAITGVTMLAPNGGLATLVLVRPLAAAAIREINVPSETSYFSEFPSAPRVYDGAYLGLAMNCAGSVAAGTLTGRLSFVWG